MDVISEEETAKQRKAECGQKQHDQDEQSIMNNTPSLSEDEHEKPDLTRTDPTSNSAADGGFFGHSFDLWADEEEVETAQQAQEAADDDNFQDEGEKDCGGLKTPKERAIEEGAHNRAQSLNALPTHEEARTTQKDMAFMNFLSEKLEYERTQSSDVDGSCDKKSLSQVCQVDLPPSLAKLRDCSTIRYFEDLAFPSDQPDFETFKSFARSENINRRKQAALSICVVAQHNWLKPSEDWDRLGEFFILLEQLMRDSIDVAYNVFRQLNLLYLSLTHSPLLNESDNWIHAILEQANLRILPILVDFLFSDIATNNQLTLQLIEELIEGRAFSHPSSAHKRGQLSVLQNLMTPALFQFLHISNEKFEKNVKGREKTTSTTSYAPLDQFLFQHNIEEWLMQQVRVFNLLSSIICDKAVGENDWLVEDVLPKYLAFYVEPTALILHSRKVREILARSLPSVAALIGSEKTDSILLPVFQRFMRDGSEVQSALLKQLSQFCEILSSKCRENFLRELTQMITVDADGRSWRQRAEFAEQLLKLVPLFPVQQINKYLSGFALTFATDKIAEVRNIGITMLASVLATFIRDEWEEKGVRVAVPLSNSSASSTSQSSSDETSTPPNLPLTDLLIAEIRSGFWRTCNWRRRQSFGRMLYLIVKGRLVSDVQFYYLLFHDLMNLSDDDVANVRQYFCLLACINHFEEFIGYSVLKRLDQIAKDDPDMETRTLALVALKKLNPDEEYLDLRGRATRLAA